MKKLSIVLAAILLSAFVSCGKETPSETTITSETTETIETETVRAHHVPSDLSFDGKTFNVAYPEWSSYKLYYFSDELTGDAMLDAIYNRKTMVEETLDVKITQTSCGDINQVYKDVKNVVSAGDPVYSYALLHSITGVYDLASTGSLYNWDDLAYVDYTADWWNREQMDVLKLGQFTYFGVSDYMIPNPYVIYFNKDMVTDYSLTNPYEMVYDGTWTVDAFLEMCESVVLDVNGDGTMNEEDQYGVGAIDNSVYISFMVGSDQMITQKGDDGRIKLALNTDKTVTLVEKFAGLKNGGAIFPNNNFDFNKGLTLFYCSSASWASSMREYDVDFGIVPYPKFDESQTNYRSQNWAGLCCIPASIDNPDFVGAVSELLAFESTNTVLPAYYDVLLTGKLTRDEDSKNMLDIAFDTICYEIGGNYFGFSGGFQNLFYTIPNLALAKGSTDFASWYAKEETAANTTIEKFYEALTDHEEANG